MVGMIGGRRAAVPLVVWAIDAETGATRAHVWTANDHDCGWSAVCGRPEDTDPSELMEALPTDTRCKRCLSWLDDRRGRFPHLVEEAKRGSV